MSVTITRDLIRARWIIKPLDIPEVTTDSLDEVAAALAHYFRPTNDKRHEIYKRRGLCPLCEGYLGK